jgi:hypothetical protein
LIRLQAYTVDIHEVFGRVGNMQARKTGHGKIDQKNCLSCTRENKLDKKLVKEKLLVCAGLNSNPRINPKVICSHEPLHFMSYLKI